MCAPRSGNQKGSVERLVGWVKGSFFKARKFQGERNLHAQLTASLVETNEKTAVAHESDSGDTSPREAAPPATAEVLPENLAMRISIMVWGPPPRYSLPLRASHVAAPSSCTSTNFAAGWLLRATASAPTQESRQRSCWQRAAKYRGGHPQAPQAL
jgi:hypothetical protein